MIIETAGHGSRRWKGSALVRTGGSSSVSVGMETFTDRDGESAVGTRRRISPTGVARRTHRPSVRPRVLDGEPAPRSRGTDEPSASAAARTVGGRSLRRYRSYLAAAPLSTLRSRCARRSPGSVEAGVTVSSSVGGRIDAGCSLHCALGLLFAHMEVSCVLRECVLFM